MWLAQVEQGARLLLRALQSPKLLEVLDKCLILSMLSTKSEKMTKVDLPPYTPLWGQLDHLPLGSLRHQPTVIGILSRSRPNRQHHHGQHQHGHLTWCTRPRPRPNRQHHHGQHQHGHLTCCTRPRPRPRPNRQHHHGQHPSA